MRGVAYLGEGEVEVREYPRPEPDVGEVLIDMEVAGLCGSDLHKYHRSREWARGQEGTISGHEPSGTVAEVGPGVENVSVGDRVSVYHSLGCGHCQACLAGTPKFCDDEGAFGRTHDGSHADFMLSDARYCMPLPEDLSFEVGAQVACTAGTGFAAARKAAPDPGKPVVVFGLGPVGLSAYLMSEAMGFRTIGVEVSEYRIDLARRLSDGTVIDGSEEDPVEAVGELTDGKGAASVIECSGNATARRQAAAAAADHGTAVYVGFSDPDLSIAFGDLLGKELTIEGNSVYSMSEYYDIVEFLQRETVPLDDMVTHRFAIDEAVEAFELFDGGETGKVVFEWP